MAHVKRLIEMRGVLHRECWHVVTLGGQAIVSTVFTTHACCRCGSVQVRLTDDERERLHEREHPSSKP